jgi:hypothetical protein
MPAVTYDEFQDRVARKLQIVATGQSIAPEDAAVIQDAAKSISAQVSIAGIALDLENGVDHEYVNAAADLVASECADDFGIADPRRSMLKANGWGLPGRSPAERALRRSYTTAKLATDTDVHKE